MIDLKFLHKETLRLAIPNILSNLTVPLLSSVDMALMGHEPDIIFIGALSLGVMIFNMLYWGFAFLRMGTTGLTGKAFGAGSQTNQLEIFWRAALLSVVLGVILIIIQTPLSHLILSLVDTEDQLKSLSLEYFSIRIWAAPATLLSFVLSGWFLGMQNARFPLYMALVANVFNILLNLFFVRVLNQDIEGVAYGTLIAQYAQVILALLLISKKYSFVWNIPKAEMLVQKKELVELFSINRDIFIRTACIIFGFAFFRISSVNSILLQLLFLLSYGVDGFAFASESMVSKYTGMKSKKGIIQAVKTSFLWAMGLAVLISGAYFFFYDSILGAFSSQNEVLIAAQKYYWWVVFLPILFTPAFIWDGVFIGATKTVLMRNTMLASTILVYIPAYYLAVEQIGAHALWLAITLFMLSRGILLGYFFIKKKIPAELAGISKPTQS